MSDEAGKCRKSVMFNGYVSDMRQIRRPKRKTPQTSREHKKRIAGDAKVSHETGDSDRRYTKRKRIVEGAEVSGIPIT